MRRRELVAGRRVVRIAIAPASADLRVEFEGLVVLELLNLSSGYEARNATFADKSGVVRLVALGGGDLAIYEQTRA